MEKFLRQLHIPEIEISQIWRTGTFSKDILRNLHNSDKILLTLRLRDREALIKKLAEEAKEKEASASLESKELNMTMKQ